MVEKKKKNIRTGISIGFLVMLITSIFVISGFVGGRYVESLITNGEFTYGYHQMYNAEGRELLDDLEKMEEFAEENETLPSEKTIGEDAEINVTDPVGSNAIVTDVTVVVEKVMPSVVSITNLYTAQYVNPYDGELYSEKLPASGSGIIFGQNEEEILIVTNYHVVEGNDELFVQFIDGEEVEAQVKGVDSAIDLAVIAIQFTDLKQTTIDQIAMARFGDSENLKVGEPAIAIGNALGYGQSVTTGVISALGRTVGDESTGIFKDLIQTDAAINPGNSGGALLNIKGEVIGINSNKIGGTTIEGMGYAIPISKVTPIINELIKNETRIKLAESEQGRIGIQGADVTSETSEIYGIPMGIFVLSVYPGTGAEEAELVEGDIIIGINDKEILTMEALQNELQYYAKGDVIILTIQKNTEAGYTKTTSEVELVDAQILSE